MKDKLTYIGDKERHLICLPYSISNLHLMAKRLEIKRCWFHNKKHLSHYDIPVKRMDDVLSKCDIVFETGIELGNYLRNKLIN